MFCISTATENIMMEVHPKIPISAFSVTLPNYEISIILFSTKKIDRLIAPEA